MLTLDSCHRDGSATALRHRTEHALLPRCAALAAQGPYGERTANGAAQRRDEVATRAACFHSRAAPNDVDSLSPCNLILETIQDLGQRKPLESDSVRSLASRSHPRRQGLVFLRLDKRRTTRGSTAHAELEFVDGASKQLNDGQSFAVL